MSKRQIQGPSGTWSHAQQTSAPPICKSHEKAQSKNTFDPAKGPGKMSGSIAQSGKRGSNSPKE